MSQGLALVLVVLAASSLLAWLALLVHPARPWDLQPVGEDQEDVLVEWPSIVAVVPARNEAGVLPATLPSLLGQSYPGDLRVVVVDDRSSDGTADVARFLAGTCGADDRLDVVRGAELPDGWAGKPWAMEQGLRRVRALEDAGAARAELVLFTDADVLHGERSVRRLVAESVHGEIGLDSRMALLHCRSLAERLLIPPFAYFFAVLYPMRRVNEPGSRVAAAAGGCMLLSRDAIDRIGGIAAIRDRIIDDVSLARAVKAAGARIRLARSRSDVRSLRRYDTLASVWRMVRRSAFTELRHSWLRLAACLAALGLVFVVPPVLLGVGLAAHATAWGGTVAGLAGAAWLAASATFLPAVRTHGLWPTWALALPLAGILYGCMTLDSALRHAAGRAEPWRPPVLESGS